LPREADRLVFGNDGADTSAQSDSFKTPQAREQETARQSGSPRKQVSRLAEGRRMRCASHRRRFLHLAMRTANEAHRQLMSLGYARR
jgi:hypothetical protein